MTLTKIENVTTTLGNLKLVVSRSDNLDYTSFQWLYTYNEADYHTGLRLSFKKGSLYTFSDSRYFTIGSTNVDISKDQAVSIAKIRAQNISWSLKTSDTSSVQVSNPTILDDYTSAELLTAPREPLVMYPYWQVSLTFDKIYPGSVYGVSYSIWADTGEVFYGNLQMIGGSVSDESTSSPSSPFTQSPQTSQHSSAVELAPPPDLDEMPEPTVPMQQPTESSIPEKTDNTFPIAATVAITGIAVVASTAILFKRKKKR